MFHSEGYINVHCCPYLSRSFIASLHCANIHAQLRVHQAALRQTVDEPGRLDLYEKGYGKDAAGIAMEAIRHAKETGKNVVLVDTAGRMQNNEPLMRSLAKVCLSRLFQGSQGCKKCAGRGEDGGLR